MHLLLIIAVFVVIFGISSVEAAKRVALVIGIDSYQSLPNLNNARTDARGMAAKLRELGWNVILKQNASRRDISRSLAKFEGQLQTAEVGLFFYAGHGIQKDDANYLIPSNAEIEDQEDLRFEAILADDFLEAMERGGAPLNIVVLDACRDNPLPKRSRSGSRGLSMPVIPKGIKGTAILYSAAPGQVAQDGPQGGNGVFTGELLKVLDQPGLKLEEVFKETARKVAKRTNNIQNPWINSSLTGDFYFREAKEIPAAITQTIERSKQETLLWETVKDSNNAAMFKIYLAEFPKGMFAAIARIKLKQLHISQSIEKTKAKARDKAEIALKTKISASQKQIDKQNRLTAVEKKQRVLTLKKANKKKGSEKKIKQKTQLSSISATQSKDENDQLFSIISRQDKKNKPK